MDRALSLSVRGLLWVRRPRDQIFLHSRLDQDGQKEEKIDRRQKEVRPACSPRAEKPGDLEQQGGNQGCHEAQKGPDRGNRVPWLSPSKSAPHPGAHGQKPDSQENPQQRRGDQAGPLFRKTGAGLPARLDPRSEPFHFSSISSRALGSLSFSIAFSKWNRAASCC